VTALDIVTETPTKVTFEPDPELKKIVDGWPKGFISTRAPSVGVVADKTFDEIIMSYQRHLGISPEAKTSAA
jgi:D-erythronate 2-dehydrogenase